MNKGKKERVTAKLGTESEGIMTIREGERKGRVPKGEKKGGKGMMVSYNRG